MRIKETREVVRKEVTDVTVGRKCDCCGKDILPDKRTSSGIYERYNYFLISTSHHDWGNDSVDSYESYDACCPDCAAEMARAYLEKAWSGINTMEITITHVQSLEDGTDRYCEQRIDGI